MMPGKNTGSPSETRAENAPGNRLLYIDNIRWVMIVLVILIHLNVTYSSLGSWYYVENKNPGLLTVIISGMFGSFTQAYFMGFLFFIAGFFVPGSCDKKGIGRFFWDRLIRLGIPTLVYMLLLHPVILFIMQSFNGMTSLVNTVSLYPGYITSLEFLSCSGPLWFALALLIFSAVYLLLRLVCSKSQISFKSAKTGLITHSKVLAMIALIFFCTFTTRLFQPIGTSILNMQLCYFSQYIILFFLGILAYRTIS